MRILVWLLRFGVFALLFALALNNQHEVALKTLFGHEWRAPIIFIVLAAFVLGCIAGVAGMLPIWWRRRATTSTATRPLPDAAPAAATQATATLDAPALDHPPRDGL